MEKCGYFAVVFLLCFLRINSQNFRNTEFTEIRENYEEMTSDNENALPFVKQYILKAKAESNLKNLIQGYRDARQFSSSVRDKHLYADSTLQASLRLKDNVQISKAYLSKGIIFYFNEKKYKQALNEYLKAFRYSKNTNDDYLKHKIIYHLGVVKIYLGYNKDAIEHFQNCTHFFEKETKREEHTNVIFNMKKAYYNSLHQMSIASINLRNFKKSDSLITIGYNLTEHKNDFRLEKGYFLKSKGILKFNKMEYNSALVDLKNSLPVLLERNDFASLSVIYFYIGKIQEVQKNFDLAAGNFIKIDSIFNKHQFILPEVSTNYDFLIDFYQQKNDTSKQIYYAKQLSKAKDQLTIDFPYLSSKVYKEFDSANYEDEINALQHTDRLKSRVVYAVIIFSILLLVIFIYRYFKEKEIKKKYKALQLRILQSKLDQNNKVKAKQENRKQIITPELEKQILLKLNEFESNHLYTKKGLTQKILADKLGTNSNYLSIIINEHKQVNYNRYISELRIGYITNILNTDKKFLQYKMEALADICGISGRQNFSKVFLEINGIRPTDFISNRIKELEKK